MRPFFYDFDVGAPNPFKQVRYPGCGHLYDRLPS